MNAQERTVYLAGPITGLTFDGTNDWRKQVQVKLKAPIVGLSPLRCKNYLAGVQGKLASDSYAHLALSTPQGITTRDRFDCQRADVVLFNFLGAERVSVGTCIEIGWADSARRPMIAVMEPGNLHDHAIVRATVPFIVGSLDEAIDLIHAILLP
jgi:nucleoside 2-deoxyribosyltransferase